MKNAETHIQRNKRRNFQDECDEPKTNRKAVTKPETFTEPQNAECSNEHNVYTEGHKTKETNYAKLH